MGDARGYGRYAAGADDCRRGSRTGLALVLAMLGACAQVDEGALDDTDMRGGGGSEQGQGTGGTAAQGDGDGDLHVPDAMVGCRPNPADDPACPEICPEMCNAIDDDCDATVDEDAEDADCISDNASSICTGGMCILSACDEGFRDCDGVSDNGCEVDISTIDDCGACGNACQFDNTVAVCIHGVCEPGECVEPYLDCDGEDGLCETFGSSLTDCGACGAQCVAPPRATPVCAGGGCAIDECLGNFGDCNGELADGCELQLNQASDCGGCGLPCAFAGSLTNCDNGACLIDSCTAGFADCDGSELTACDSLDSDAHCGACGRACSVAALKHVLSAGCDTRTCVIECEAGFGNCDGDPANGCETPLTGVSNCTGCGIACDPDRALGNCDAGSCGVGACDDGWADCDGDPQNGCETDTGRPANCGGCAIQCQLDPPIGCNGGVCMGVLCPEGQADCSMPVDDVCEADLSSDATCGSCNVRCQFDNNVDGHGSVACTVENALPGQMAWGCEVTCADGFADCDGDYRNGCEVDLTDLDNCGRCGNVCTKSRATPTCENRVCEVDTCDLDWGDCDGDDLDCETQLNSADDCGACGNDCDFPFAASQCSGSPGSRACVISQCVPVEHRNCDGASGTGCETDTRSDPKHCNGCGNDCTTGPQVQGGVCTASACTFTCVSNFADCTGAAGCETNLLSPGTCGGCNNDCRAAPQVASAACLPGAGNPVCDVTSCVGGFGDCNGDPGDGCEVTTASSEVHCGACSGDPGHQPCQNLPNAASSTCNGGSCTIDSCTVGFEDCDQNPANGCELDIANDPPCCDPMMDADGDGSDDCADQCPTDPDKSAPGVCGCFVSDADSDGDGAADCVDACSDNPNIQGDCLPHRRLLTIQGAQVPSAETHFPVLVRFAGDASLLAYADPTGLDIRFEDTGGNPLPFERESYDAATGALVAWVAMDLTGSDQDFHIYYGDGDLTEKASSGDVWDDQFEAVYHLADLADSTSHGRHGTNRGTTAHGSGVVGAARNFNGDAEILGPRGVLPVNDDYWTFSYWGRGDPDNSSGDNEQWAICTQNNAADGVCMGIETPPAPVDGNMLTYTSGWRRWEGTVLPDLTWARVDARVYTSSSGYIEFSLDGGAWDRANFDTRQTRHNQYSYIMIGGEQASSNENWLGQLDEVRISSALRSDGWLRAEYNNQRPGSTFISAGTEEAL